MNIIEPYFIHNSNRTYMFRDFDGIWIRGGGGDFSPLCTYWKLR